MVTAQVLSSPPVVTPQTHDDDLPWKEPKRKPVIDVWDFGPAPTDDNRCRDCGWRGFQTDEDYDPCQEGIHFDQVDGRYSLDRSLIYTSRVHDCQWAIRGREALAGFPVYLLRKPEDGFDWLPWKVKQLVYAEYLGNVGERICTGDGMVFIGSVGTGKTHLAVHAGRVAVRRGYSVFFSTVTELLSDLRQTFRDGSALTEKQIMEHVRDVDLLILDDATVEKQTDWTQDALYRVVNARYEREKATILTANTSLDGMRDRLGDRLVSRLYERSVVLDFTGPDYRLQIRKQRQAA